MHPESELIAFVRGGLPPAERARVAAHVDGCSACRRAADESRVVLEALVAGAPAPPPLDWGRYQAELRARVAASPVIQTEVDQDPIEPGRELRLAPEARGCPIHPEKRFLREVAGVLGVAQQRPRQPVRAPLVPGDQHVEGRLVLGRDPRQQRFIRCLLTQRGLWGQPSHSSLAGSKHPDPGPAGPARVG